MYITIYNLMASYDFDVGVHDFIMDVKVRNLVLFL